MGEEGTAGQVGGMEASKEVRQNMAKSSRQWKCGGCGGRTNEEIMREWWDLCGEKGIKVEEEAGLEELPDGLKLGFKDQLGNNQKTEAGNEDSAAKSAGEVKTMADGEMPVPRSATVPGVIESTSPKRESDQPKTISRQMSGTSNGRSVEAFSTSAPSASKEPQTDSTKPTAASSSTTVAATAQSMPATTTAQEPQAATPVLDKAISGLVLALLFMVLKKVLYNPNVIAYDY